MTQFWDCTAKNHVIPHWSKQKSFKYNREKYSKEMADAVLYTKLFLFKFNSNENVHSTVQIAQIVEPLDMFLKVQASNPK